MHGNSQSGSQQGGLSSNEHPLVAAWHFPGRAWQQLNHHLHNLQQNNPLQSLQLNNPLHNLLGDNASHHQPKQSTQLHHFPPVKPNAPIESPSNKQIPKPSAFAWHPIANWAASPATSRHQEARSDLHEENDTDHTDSGASQHPWLNLEDQSPHPPPKKLPALPPPTPVTREELGRATWVLLHTLAAQLPNKPSRQQKRDVKSLVDVLTRVYPCGDCATHWKEIVKAHPVQVGSRLEFEQWLCDAHNHVNRSLGKPQYNCATVALRWSPLDCGEGENATGCSLELAGRK